MSLSDLWLSSRAQLEDKLVKQIISFSGTGELRDGSASSSEFRDYLSKIPSRYLARYAQECLREPFEGSGLALQDVINQIGRRLGFSIEYGRYRGSQSQIGFDGIWRFPSGHAVIVEVKTTDTYRIDLNTLAGYRQRLVDQQKMLEDTSSILVVVGRQDTGDLEAQIRGSRHAWDIRLISVEALLRLVSLKEEVEDPRIIDQICAILIPREFTRVDGIIDIVFSAAEEVRKEEVFEDEEEQEDTGQIGRVLSLHFTPVQFREATVAKIAANLAQPLIKLSKASYSSSDGITSLVCIVSKEHNKSGQISYWFGFHPHQKAFLATSAKSYLALGCGSEETTLMIPYSELVTWLLGMNKTTTEDRFYWHISVFRESERLVLHRRKGYKNIDLDPYLLPPINRIV
ncbi:MAG: hypothetical protein QOD33_43 [Pyrinomonadaceae bacterium]|jgi:hypothetical protein|nr:hypothetical protein [Pyrinomonadaceae bacterium]